MSFKQEHVACPCGWMGTAFMWHYDTSKPCPTCGQPATRIAVEAPDRAPSVIPDEIPGGIDIKNAICNADGSPRRFYSKSAIREEAARRGYTILGETPKDPGSRWV